MSQDNGIFLVCYDYGMGALWWWITAHSAAEITDTYKDVRVLDGVPVWWTEEEDKLTPRVELNRPDATLKELTKVR